MSETISAALVAALNEMPIVDRDREVTVKTQGGGSYSYKYATLSNVIELVKPILAKHELAVTQNVGTRPVDDLQGQVWVETVIHHVSGEVMRFGPIGFPTGSTPQQAGSAITYARRYALTAALGLATEDDDDAQSAVQPVKEAPVLSPGDWLARMVESFGKWTEEERREAYTAAMTELKYERLSSLDRAKAVFEHMGEAYYATFPTDDGAPF